MDHGTATLREQIFKFPLAYRLMQNLVSGRDRPQRLRDIFGLQTSDRVLDIGSGDGSVSSVVAAQVSRYVGIDHNPAYIAKAKRVCSNLSNVEFHLADAGDELVANLGPFDLVMISGVLHHLDSPTIKNMLGHSREIMAPNGRLIVLEPVFEPDQRLSARLLIAADRGRFVRDRDGYVGLLEQHFNTVRTEIRSDLIRIPYSHLIATCSHSNSC